MVSMESMILIPVGTTNDITTCTCCGRKDLNRTVKMDLLDTDGSRIDTYFYGTDCAARHSGRKVTDIIREAREADRAEAQARYEAARNAANIEFEALLDWLHNHYGIRDHVRLSELNPNRTAYSFITEARAALATA